jgi:hypothetical protein
VFFPLAVHAGNSARLTEKNKCLFFSLCGQQVDLERTFTFRNSKQTYSGIPIIVANMDTVGTFEMAVVMSQVRRGLFISFITFAAHSMARSSDMLSHSLLCV